MQSLINILFYECKRDFNQLDYNVELIQKACLLPNLFARHIKNTRFLNQNPDESSILLFADWNIDDLLVGNYMPQWFSFSAQTHSMEEKVTQYLLNHLQVKQAVVAGNELINRISPHRGGIAEYLGAVAVAELYEYNSLNVFWQLFTNMNCQASWLGSLECNLLKDVLFLILQDAITDISVDSLKLLNDIHNYNEYLAKGKFFDGINNLPTESLNRSNVEVVNRLVMALSIISKMDELAAINLLTENNYKSSHNQIFKLVVDLNAVGGFLGEVNPDESVVYSEEAQALRGLTALDNVVKLQKVIKNHQLVLPDLAKQEFEKWKNSFQYKSVKEALVSTVRQSWNRINFRLNGATGDQDGTY